MKPKRRPAALARTLPASGPGDARGWPRTALYVAAVVVAWMAGLVFSSGHAEKRERVAEVLALPLARVLAIRLACPRDKTERHIESLTRAPLSAQVTVGTYHVLVLPTRAHAGRF